jgi:hypothetical protein
MNVQTFAVALAVVGALAAIGEALTEFFIAPMWDRYELDRFWLTYVGALIAFALVLISGQNLLGEYLPANLTFVGRLLTAALAGRGSNWIHDFFSKRSPVERTARSAPLTATPEDPNGSL